MKALLLAIMFTCLFSTSFSQKKYDELEIGDKIHFKSKILGEERTVVVIPPYDLKDRPGEKFPVLLVLDPGNNLFGAFGIVNYYSDMLKIIPRMIIVSVVSPDREKDYLPVASTDHPTGGGAVKFLDFLDKELMPFIESSYPSSKERCIMGHSAGGLFAVYALEHQPALFSSFICIDPSMWYDEQSATRAFPSFIEKNPGLHKNMFISLSGEKDMKVQEFADTLRKYAPPSFRWKLTVFPDETHNSLGFKSMCEGLEMIYSEKTEKSETKVMKENEKPGVTGIGGIFFRAKDVKSLKEWYGQKLGLAINEYGSVFEYRNANRPEEVNYLSWSPFSEKTKYFDPSTKEFMINYRVRHLEQLVEQLRKEGVTIVDQIETYDYGKFVHIMDPEGNKLELWEPVDRVLQEIGGETTK